MLKDTPPSGVVFFLNSVFQNFSICVIVGCKSDIVV